MLVRETPTRGSKSSVRTPRRPSRRMIDCQTVAFLSGWSAYCNRLQPIELVQLLHVIRQGYFSTRRPGLEPTLVGPQHAGCSFLLTAAPREPVLRSPNCDQGTGWRRPGIAQLPRRLLWKNVVDKDTRRSLTTREVFQFSGGTARREDL